jgi:hypothetical protein
MAPSALDVADELYARWNDGGLSVVTERVDPDIELVCDPLRPTESVLRGVAGWNHWVARWESHVDLALARGTLL